MPKMVPLEALIRLHKDSLMCYDALTIPLGSSPSGGLSGA